MESFHVPVLKAEVLKALGPALGNRVVDGTLGHGGHALALGAQIGPGGVLVGLDRDPAMLATARARLQQARELDGVAVYTAATSYERVQEVLQDFGLASGVEAILLDLGVNSRHLDDAERGFSFSHDGPLDGRFNPEEGTPTMADLVNTETEEQLARWFRDYGDERYARRIARRIVERRGREPFARTRDLAETAEKAVPAAARRQRIDASTRIFQALRIVVNDELTVLQRGLDACLGALVPGGRMAVISFHSGEDRVVKKTFRRVADPVADPSNPYSAQSEASRPFRLPQRKAIKCSEQEAAQNPRARSARLRVIERRQEVADG